ncbi:MAG: cell wall hydrolase [Clostridia bacterium]|nr:cell wall hydrolase [Clostridia bacterium]
MKKIVLALVFLFMAGFLPQMSKADALSNVSPYETPVCMTVNGKFIDLEVPCFLNKGYTMVPIRAVSDALLADEILWNEKDSSVKITKGNTSITLKNNSKKAIVNGKTVNLDTASGIFHDRLFVPVRFVAESFGAKVSWDKNTYTVNISDKSITVPEHLIGDRGYSEDDLYWLSRIINSESQGEPMKGKIAVANVVLNRVESKLYANNIYDVIFDTNYGVQFTPVLNGSIYNAPLGDSIIAAKRALSGESHAGKSLYFLNPRTAQSFWIVNNRIFYKSIGNHDFYL